MTHNIGRPIVDIANYEFKSNPFKMGHDFNADEDKFKIGAEYAFAMGAAKKRKVVLAKRKAQIKASAKTVAAAKKGNRTALKKVAVVKQQAAKGNPKAKAALADMRRVDMAQRRASSRKPRKVVAKAKGKKLSFGTLLARQPLFSNGLAVLLNRR